ncbi:hypothetical protein QF037_000740 [Streptomyces canus]|nr:hypothetical protein [Streptomyces canus]MDQ0596395.1 hypothetical protein [Streptomyces canus]
MRGAGHRALTEFPQSYGDQNERDFTALKAAHNGGRIKAARL